MNTIGNPAPSNLAQANPWLNPLYRAGHRIAARLQGIDKPTAREMVAIDDLNSAGARVIASRYWNMRERIVMSDYCGNFRQLGEVVYCRSIEDGHWVVGIAFQWPLRTAKSSLPSHDAATT